MDFEVRNRAHKELFFVDFCLIIGSGESGKSPVSADRLKNGACDNGFKVGYFG